MPHHDPRPLTCLLCLALCATGAGAQQALSAPSTPELNEIVVTATRIDSPILESPSAISVITPEELGAPGVVDLSSVLEGRAGVVVNDYGPVGSLKNASLRGSTSNQVLVLLDGVRMNGGNDGGIDLSTLPMDAIDHVEVLQGTASTIYGSGAIGGVINIITRKPETPEITLSLTNGSYVPHAASDVSAAYSSSPPYVTYSQSSKSANFWNLLDSQKVEMSVASKVGDVGFTGSGSLTRAANGFTWNDPVLVDGYRARTGADVLSGSTNLGLDAPLANGTVTVKTMLDSSDVGLPGSLTGISDGARQRDSSATGIVGWKTDRFLLDDLSLDMKTSYKYDDLRVDYPGSPESFTRTQTASLDFTQRYAPWTTASFVYGGSAYLDNVDTNNYANTRQRINLGVFLSVPVSVVDALTVTPSLRYDYFTDFPGSLSYSLAAVLMLSDQSSLRASVGSAYRVPALDDLYWYDPAGPTDPTGYTTGNPNLKPETAYSADIGWSLLSPGLTLDVSAFTRLVFNNIVWTFDGTVGPYGAYLPENLTRTFYPGAEIHARVPLVAALSIQGSYTFIYSYVLDNGTTTLSFSDNVRVPYVPVHSASLSLNWNGPQVTAAVEGQVVSDKVTPQGTLWGYFVANASLKYRASDRITLSLAGKNLLDTLYYTQYGYPMPPFSVEMGVQVHL